MDKWRKWVSGGAWLEINRLLTIHVDPRPNGRWEAYVENQDKEILWQESTFPNISMASLAGKDAAKEILQKALRELEEA